MNISPEYASIEAFVQFLLDDERTTFTLREAQKIAEILHRPIKEVADEIKTFGFNLNR